MGGGRKTWACREGPPPREGSAAASAHMGKGKRAAGGEGQSPPAAKKEKKAKKKEKKRMVKFADNGAVSAPGAKPSTKRFTPEDPLVRVNPSLPCALDDDDAEVVIIQIPADVDEKVLEGKLAVDWTHGIFRGRAAAGKGRAPFALNEEDGVYPRQLFSLVPDSNPDKANLVVRPVRRLLTLSRAGNAKAS